MRQILLRLSIIKKHPHSRTELVPADSRRERECTETMSPLCGHFQDRIGKGYTLLRFDNDELDLSELITGFEKSGAAFEVLSLDDLHAVEVYEGYKLFLLRPDMHIIWRGNAPPIDPALLTSIATSHKN